MLNVVVLLAVAKLLWGSGPDIESGRRGVDVERYRFDVAVSDSTNQIAARADVTIRFTGSIESFFLDLVGPNDSGLGMTVSAVRVGGEPAAFRHEQDRLTIETPDVSNGSTRTYSIDYSGIPADGLIISTNKFGERTFFGDNWPNRARNWLPTVDHVSDKALVEWVVSTPEHYEVVANGELLGQTVSEPGLRTVHYRTIAPISTKIMVIGVARFAIDHRGRIDGVPVETWVFPADEKAGFEDFSVADVVLRYFVTQIGEFPYAKLANVESTTRYGGMENASAIFYSEQSVTGWRRNEATVAHEIAHQWFGDSVTEADWHHIWLSEGFATYFANLYWEHAYGRQAMEDRLGTERRAVINYTRSNPESPVIDYSITDPNNLLSANSYLKGGWVLHMLRHEIGDKAFWSGVRSYYERFRDQNALTEDFRDVMEEASGVDLDAFFDQWIYRAGHPILKVGWAVEGHTNGRETLLLTIEQEQALVFDFPLEIAITPKSGDETVEHLRVSERRQTFRIDTEGGIRTIRLDPNTNLLAEFSDS